MAHHHSHTLQHTRHRDLDAQLVKGSHKPQQHRSETTDGGTWLRTANNDNLKQAERSTWMPGAAHGAKKHGAEKPYDFPYAVITHPGLWQTTEANFTSSSSASVRGSAPPAPHSPGYLSLSICRRYRLYRALLLSTAQPMASYSFSCPWKPGFTLR